MTRPASLLLATVAVLAIAGCSHPEDDSSPVRAADWADSDRITAEQEIALRRATVDLEGWKLAFGPEIVQACPDVRTTESTLDSAWRSAQWKDDIVALARCMRDGSLRDTDVDIVGHQSRLGWDEYGMHVGRERANRIRAALVELGVDESRLSVSRHKLGHGDDAASTLEGKPDSLVEVHVRAPSVPVAEK